MAEPDPTKPQVTDPVTVADLIRVLNIRGALGVLDVADVIIPTISVGQLSPLEVTLFTAVFRSTDIFSNGSILGPAGGTVLADTGPLPAGTYDVLLFGSTTDINGSNVGIAFEHRNAANAANLAVFLQLLQSQTVLANVMPRISFAYELAANERMRMVNNSNSDAADRYVATIFARIRG